MKYDLKYRPLVDQTPDNYKNPLENEQHQVPFHDDTTEQMFKYTPSKVVKFSGL